MLGAQLPSALQIPLTHSDERAHGPQILLAPQTGLRRSVQSLLLLQPMQRPPGPQIGVAELRLRQAVSSVPGWQARHESVIASQIGAPSSLQLSTVRQLPIVEEPPVQLESSSENASRLPVTRPAPRAALRPVRRRSQPSMCRREVREWVVGCREGAQGKKVCMIVT